MELSASAGHAYAVQLPQAKRGQTITIRSAVATSAVDGTLRIGSAGISMKAGETIHLVANHKGGWERAYSPAQARRMSLAAIGVHEVSEGCRIPF